jgi:hypothetical protein
MHDRHAVGAPRWPDFCEHFSESLGLIARHPLEPERADFVLVRHVVVLELRQQRLAM